MGAILGLLLNDENENIASANQTRYSIIACP